MTSTQPRAGGLGVRSIDYVPLNERHGRVWHLGPLWFMSNAQIATLAVGLISISEGASLFWSVLAIVAGVLAGTLFMAFHSAQGPQLGLPQMIQSRPQFGYLGALLVWLFACVQIVRRGHYAIAEIFNPRGSYGRWGWRGILAYLIGFAAMIPFFKVGTLYEGPAATALGGADISFFIGLPVAGLLYYAFTRSVDVTAEARIAEAEAAELEKAATQHRTS